MYDKGDSIYTLFVGTSPGLGPNKLGRLDLLKVQRFGLSAQEANELEHKRYIVEINTMYKLTYILPSLRPKRLP